MENESLWEGDIKKTYLKLATPTAINMIIVIVYSMADTFFVSQLQNAEMVAGVSLCGQLRKGRRRKRVLLHYQHLSEAI